MTLPPELMLQLAMLVPLLAVAGIVGCRSRPNLREAVTLLSGFIVLLLVLALYRTHMAGQRVEVHWLEILPDLELAFRLEPLGLIFALVAGSLWPVTSIYAIGYMRGHHEQNQTRFYAFFAVAISAVMGIAFAANLLTLFIFYEVLTLCTYPLVTHSGSPDAMRGGRVYLGVLLSTSILFLLLAIIGVWLEAGTLTFTEGGVFGEQTPQWLSGALLVLFVLGIGKAAMMPFHRWLPAAMVAPTPVSALLHAVAVVKAGVFTVLKVCVLIFGIDLLNALWSTQLLLYLGAFTVLSASLVAMRQDNLKARLAYSTVSQLGYISIGALLANQAGITGGAMHIATHAVGKITLFFCAGAILVAAHKTEISDMRGLGRRMPLTMAAFFLASLSIIGVPPMGGTWSKWYLLLGTLDAQQWTLMAVLMLSSLLNIAYLLPIPVRAFLDGGGRPVVLERSAVREAPLPALLALLFTTACCLLLFIWPQALHELAASFAGPLEMSHGTE